MIDEARWRPDTELVVSPVLPSGEVMVPCKVQEFHNAQLERVRLQYRTILKQVMPSRAEQSFSTNCTSRHLPRVKVVGHVNDIQPWTSQLCANRFI